MKWLHSVDGDWLDARRKYLSSSDIVRMLPTTMTGRPRSASSIEEAIRKVWSDKQARITQDDIMSTGVMARGHILEPYAIDAFNKSKVSIRRLHHWDDTLVYRNGLACSPDALDVKQPHECSIELDGDKTKVKMVGEVKCYNPASHYECGLITPVTQLAERWQIAAAMYVMPSIDMGWLIFFNPNVTHPLFSRFIMRVDLADELEAIDDLLTVYSAFVTDFAELADVICNEPVKLACRTEDDIVAELEEKMEIDGKFNP